MSIVTINSRSLGEISYEDTEYKIEIYFIDGRSVSCLRYIGESDKPTQPVGLKDYSFIFSNRKDIETLDLSHWDMSEAENLNGMFCDSVSLKDISSISGWDVSNVKIMSKLFRNCYRLNDISYLKDWDMSKVTNNDYMFDGCENISIYEILCLYHHYGTNGKLSDDDVTGVYNNDQTSVIISNDLCVNLKSITGDEKLCGDGRGMNRLPIAKLCKSMSGNIILNFYEVCDDIDRIISKNNISKLELSTVYGRFGKVLKELNSYTAKVLCSGDRGRKPPIDDIHKTMSNSNVIINFGNCEEDITKIISENVADKLISEGFTKIYFCPSKSYNDVLGVIPVAYDISEISNIILENAKSDPEKERNIVITPLCSNIGHTMINNNISEFVNNENEYKRFPDIGEGKHQEQINIYTDKYLVYDALNVNYPDDSILVVEVPDRLDGDHIVSLMERCFTNLSEMKQEEEIKPDTRYRRPRKNEKHYF